MFSKFRTGAKKGGNRQSRYIPQDDEPPRPATQRGQSQVTGIHHNRSADALTATTSGQAAVSAEPPVLPQIPRVASKASQHTASPTSPIQPTIRTIDTQKTLAEETSPESDISVDIQEQDGLHLVKSLDQPKASSPAGNGRVNASLMPPPPRPSVRSEFAVTGLQQRSQTDLGLRPTSARTTSSKGSSAHEFPVQHRLPEPDDYVTPPQAIQLGHQPPPRPKSRLTKLNPLSYLTRKKSSQSPVDELDQTAIAKRASFTPTKPLSEDFDPRIKGKLVHDFSAPRLSPAHFVSIQNLRSAAAEGAIELPPSGIYDSRRGSDSNLPKLPLGDPSPERRHVPVFKEDFNNSAEGWRLNPDDRRNQASSDIVDKVAALEEAAKSEKRKSALPAFAVHMPEDIPSPHESFSTPQSARTTPQIGADLEPAMTPNSIQQTPDSLKPPKHTPRPDASTSSPQGSPLADRSRATSPDAPQAFSSLPKHLRSKTASIKSQASRFSFDMAPGGSAAQEKLLEERHRQRQRARATSLTSVSIHEEDGFDEDDIDFGADGEEDIPGMNDDEYDFGPRGGVANMTLDAAHNDDYEEDIPGMDDEDDDEFGTGEMAGSGLRNMTLESFQSTDMSHQGVQPLALNGKPQGLGLLTTGLDTLENVEPETTSTLNPNSAENPRTISALQNRVEHDINELNDAFYFDDGEFRDELGLDDGEEEEPSDNMDESMFDQNFERGKKIDSLKPLPAELVETVDSSRPSTRPESIDSEVLAGKRRSEVTADTSRTSMQLPHARRSSAYGQHSEFDATAGLTQENLSAYHNALAFAANQAAKQGRFERQAGTEDGEPGGSPKPAPRQRNVSFTEPRSTQNHAFLPGSDIGDDLDDDFNFDDTMDDDAIIDAANAEALENDDDGFYGSEFGFYASSYGSSDSQAFHGGYFGPAGGNQIKRSHSGREAFQEPSLTPITERSEWSNRNSMINFAMHGSGISPSVTSPGGMPGLAQLADQMQLEGSPGEDMSLSALLKARRGAFGGSSTSLHSMGNTGPGSRSGSPSLYAFQQQQGVSPLSGSGIAPPPSLPEENEEYEDRRSRAGSLTNPMLTLQTQNLTLRPTTSGSDSSPLKRGTPVSGRPYGHSRNNSGADSVSYAVQKNDEGEEMWVVEKRRTLDNGDVEILNRNIVRGTL